MKGSPDGHGLIFDFRFAPQNIGASVQSPVAEPISD
jgi:hypothetical protein